MTSIVLILVILGVAMVFLITEWIPLEVTALLCLGAVALTGLVSTEQALSGFSNPAVITVWAVFILSGGLTRTGVANLIGRHVLYWSGKTEPRIIAVVMISSGVLSAFMNNVAVAALMLPVVIDIAQKTGTPPSRVLMPLAYGSLLGGLTTMIGTPPNILVSAAMEDAGLGGFGLFEFAPIGLIIMAAGTAYMVFIGRHLLPSRDHLRDSLSSAGMDLTKEYDLAERLFTMRVPDDSTFGGKTLSQSRLGSGLGLHVAGVIREGRTVAAPGPEFALQKGDQLLVAARLERIKSLAGWRELVPEQDEEAALKLLSNGLAAAEVQVREDSPLIGVSLQEADFRNQYGVTLFSLFRDGTQLTGDLRSEVFCAGDTLLVHGGTAAIEKLAAANGLTQFQLLSGGDISRLFERSRELLVLRVPDGCPLAGQSLQEAGLAEVMGMVVLLVERADGSKLAPVASTRLEAGDVLHVKGSRKDLQILQGLEQLEMEEPGNRLESEEVGMVEAVLSPRSALTGKTVRQIHFREKYNISVLAIWREGRSYRTNLGNIPLKHGDSILLIGPRERLNLLGREADFIVLNHTAKEPPRLEKAKLAMLIMGLTLLPVILGWVPIAIAAVVGAAVMVLSRCLTMAEAYRAIEWKAVFLIAGMLPMGIALDESGAATFLAHSIVSAVGTNGPLAVMAGLLILTLCAKLVIPSAALVVLMAPIVLQAADDLAVSPATMMMGLAMAASSSFMSPIAHPANLLVMGPGGYRFWDYVKVGLPLTLIILLLVLVVVPWIWPFAL